MPEGPGSGPSLRQRAENGTAGQEVGLTAPVAVRDLNRIAIRIQHHPSRTGLPRRIVRELSAFEDVQVIPDPDPDGPMDSWRTYRRCLESLPPGASHLVILQDDALPVPGFSEKLVAAIDAHPTAPLLLFVPGFGFIRKAFADAQRAGAAWTHFRVGAFVAVVATAYPRGFVEGLLDWADNGRVRPGHAPLRRPLRGADDGIIALYCRARRIRPIALVPCIVDHDESVASIGRPQRRGGPHRRAALI